MPHDPAARPFRYHRFPHPSHPLIYLYLAVGGVLGTLARHEIGKWAVGQAAHAFPWHTFAINLAGSLVLGFAMRASETVPLSPETRGFVTVGFCGAFTTFSTFSWETVVMIQQGQWGRAAAYALGSVAAGIACVLLGMWMASAILRPRA